MFFLRCEENLSMIQNLEQIKKKKTDKASYIKIHMWRGSRNSVG